MKMFYILEGELTIWLDGKIPKIGKGAYARVPKGMTHYFKITSTDPCKALNMYTPGGFEEGVIRNATKAEALTLPSKGLAYYGSTDKNDMHTAVDIQAVNLLEDPK